MLREYCLSYENRIICKNYFSNRFLTYLSFDNFQALLFKHTRLRIEQSFFIQETRDCQSLILYCTEEPMGQHIQGIHLKSKAIRNINMNF